MVGPPAWVLGEVLTIPPYENVFCYEIFTDILLLLLLSSLSLLSTFCRLFTTINPKQAMFCIYSLCYM